MPNSPDLAIAQQGSVHLAASSQPSSTPFTIPTMASQSPYTIKWGILATGGIAESTSRAFDKVRHINADPNR